MPGGSRCRWTAAPKDCVTGHEMSIGDQKAAVRRCDAAGLQHDRLRRSCGRPPCQGPVRTHIGAESVIHTQTKALVTGPATLIISFVTARSSASKWWRGQDLNLRPSGYEPDELPDCSTPRREPTTYHLTGWCESPRASRHAGQPSARFGLGGGGRAGGRGRGGRGGGRGRGARRRGGGACQVLHLLQVGLEAVDIGLIGAQVPRFEVGL